MPTFLTKPESATGDDVNPAFGGAVDVDADAGSVDEAQVRRRAAVLLGTTFTAAAMALLGVVVLVGWTFDLTAVTHIPRAGQAMVPWTAVSIVCLASSVLTWVRGRAGWTIALSSASLLFGVVMQAEFLTGHSFGVDTMLFKASLASELSKTPGRMAPNTALAVVLISVAVLAMRGRRPALSWLSVGAGILGSAVGMVALLGYAAGKPELYRIGSLTRMALPTSIAVVLLGAAVAVTAGIAGPLALLTRDGPGARVARALLPAIAVSPLVVGLIGRIGREAGLYSEDMVLVVILAALASLMTPMAWAFATRLDSGYRERLAAESVRAHLAMIVGSTTDAIMSTDLDGKLLTWNEGAAKLFGYEAQEVLGEDVTMLAVPGDELSVSSKLGRVFGGERIDGVQTKRRRKDGEIVEVWLSVSPLRDNTGRIIGAAAIMRDNTAQRRADAQFRELVESAPDALVLADEHGLIRLVNEQTERLLGYARHELLGSPVELLLPREQRSAHVLQRLKYTEMPRTRAMGEDRQLNARHRDGTLIPVEISLAPLQTPDGKLISAAVRDVRQRRAAEDARRAAEQRFRRVFEDSPLGMAVIDPDLNLVEVNGALSALTGMAVQDIEGRSLATITTSDGELLQRVPELFANASLPKIEQQLIRAGGSSVWTSVTAAAIGLEDRDGDGRDGDGRDGDGRDGDGRDGDGRENGTRDGLLIFEDITERRTFEGRLQYLADHDALTGLFNRRRFEEEIERERNMTARYGGTGALLMLDLDHFKYVNDTLGHNAGDEVLSQVARVLRTTVRSTDIVGRLGGDEFGILLPRSTAIEAGRVADSLLRALREQVQIIAGDRVQGAAASIGIAPFGSDGEDQAPSELFIQADIALYDAKDAGRNGFSFYDPTEDRRGLMLGRLTWGDRLRHALDNDGFVLLAQPIVDLSGKDSRPRSELLLRMKGEDGQFILPDVFLYLTDRFGLTEDLDAWVVNRAMDMLAAETRAGRPMMFEINLSGQAVGSDRICSVIQDGISRTGVDPESLCFEITERVAITAVDRARQFAQDLRSLGCEFALDDFGAGFASFYYLKHLVFDYLKIDGEFVKGLVNNDVDQLIVRSLVQMAGGLSKRTIAEYVEDEPTLDLLRTFGVDYAQGYHVGRPCAVGEAWRQVANGGWVTSTGVPTTTPAMAHRGPTAGSVIDLSSRRRTT